MNAYPGRRIEPMASGVTRPPWTGCALVATTIISLAGCGSSKQQISVRTTPPGAEVQLQRRGDMEIDASIPVAGVSGSIDGARFEDEFVSLGNAPVEWKFELDDSQGSASFKGQSVSATKHYREGTIRVLLPGYQTIERLVAFSGSPIELHLTLQRKN
jgi:hypothetical protein